MTAKVCVDYSQQLDLWSWEVTVNNNSAYGFEQTYENALDHARDQLEDMLEDMLEGDAE